MSIKPGQAMYKTEGWIVTKRAHNFVKKFSRREGIVSACYHQSHPQSQSHHEGSGMVSKGDVIEVGKVLATHYYELETDKGHGYDCSNHGVMLDGSDGVRPNKVLVAQ
jgi:hypothetical protein